MSTGGEGQDITALLLAHGRGDSESLDQLVEMVYEDLRRIARGQLRRKARGMITGHCELAARQLPAASSRPESRFPPISGHVAVPRIVSDALGG